MSLSFTGLEKLEGGQQGIEGFFGNKPTPSTSLSPRKPDHSAKRQRTSSPSERMASSEGAIPKAIGDTQKRPRLPTLHTGSKAKTDFFSNSTIKKNGESSTQAIVPHDEDDEVIEIIESDIPPEDDVGQWACPKCSFRTEKGVEGVQQRDQRQEHEDFHFAQDLQNGVSPIRPKAVSGIGIGTAKKKKERKPEGIKAFFTKSVKKE